MGEYTVEIEGRYTLSQIELQIQSEELGFSKFLSMTIGEDNGRETNLATFEELPTGTTPKRPTLVASKPGQPAEPGKVEVWSGTILAGNQAVYAALYRDL